MFSLLQAVYAHNLISMDPAVSGGLRDTLIVFYSLLSPPRPFFPFPALYMHASDLDSTTNINDFFSFRFSVISCSITSKYITNHPLRANFRSE